MVKVGEAFLESGFPTTRSILMTTTNFNIAIHGGFPARTSTLMREKLSLLTTQHCHTRWLSYCNVHTDYYYFNIAILLRPMKKLLLRKDKKYNLEYILLSFLIVPIVPYFLYFSRKIQTFVK